MKTEIKVFRPLCMCWGRMFISVTSVISSDSQLLFPVHPLCLCRSFLCHFVTEPFHLTLCLLFFLVPSGIHLARFFGSAVVSHCLDVGVPYSFVCTSSKIDVCKHSVPASYLSQKNKEVEKTNRENGELHKLQFLLTSYVQYFQLF